MVVVKPLSDFNAFEIRKILGRPNGLGQYFVGSSFLGEDIPFAGVYQKRPRKTGQIFVKMKFSIANDPRTSLQISQREKFANAVFSWQSLTSEQKHVYNQLQYPPRMTGFNRYIRSYMRDEI